MKKLVVTLVCAAGASFGAEMTGYISDASCGARNAKSTAEARECAESCIKAGSDPVFVTQDNKVLKITDKSRVKNLVGKVVVDGKVKGDTLEIASIRSAEAK